MNILFLMTDQHRVDTLGCYASQMAQTPHLDALAASGSRFTNFFTPTAICAPARASLLTGLAPHRHGLLGNDELQTAYRSDLDPQQFTFAAAVREAGYRLALFGKWHVGRQPASHYGFEGPHFQGWRNPVEHRDYQRFLAEHDFPPYAISEPIYRPGGGENLLAARLRQPPEATFEAYLATRTIEWLHAYAEGNATPAGTRTDPPAATSPEQAAGPEAADGAAAARPFFLATHFFGPHLPYVVPDAYFDRFDPDTIELPASVAETFDDKPSIQRNYADFWGFDQMSEATSRKLLAAYLGYVSLIDEQIGRILAALQDCGLAEDTAVFFTADHGEFTGAHRLHSKGPAMYDDIYRIPALVRVPGAPAGQVRDELCTLTDCTATILDLAGLDPTPATDGLSLLPLVQGQHPSWRSEVVAEFHGLHFPYAQRMITDSRYKLVINPESRNELYDLTKDPHELHNKATDPAYADVRARLTQRLYQILVERGDGFHHWMRVQELPA